MIIVEGPDNAGKTTLVKKIAAALDYDIMHSGGPNKDHWEHHKMCMGLKRHIFDRYVTISEEIYGPIIRGCSAFEPHDWTRDLRPRKPLIIYCRPHTYVLTQYKEHEQKEHEDGAHVVSMMRKRREIVAQYDAQMFDLGIEFEVIRYNYHVDRLGVFLKLCQVWEECNER